MPTLRPEVSIVLCIFNGGKYLRLAIDSVLNQSFTDFELILVDDGSTDETLEIIRQYECKDSRCRVFTGPNQGLIASRNMGILQAQADIVALMDADDLCMPDRIAIQKKYLDHNPECVAVGSQVLFIDPVGRPIATFLLGTSHQDIDNANMAGRGGAIINPSSMIRKKAIISVGMYQKDYLHAEDIDLFLRLAEIGKLANIPETLLHYRQHMSSIGYTHAKAQRESTQKALMAAQQRRPGHNLSSVRSVSSEPDKTSLFHIYNKWAWWALDGRNLATARHYGWMAFRESPFVFSHLKLLFCILRGH